MKLPLVLTAFAGRDRRTDCSALRRAALVFILLFNGAGKIAPDPGEALPTVFVAFSSGMFAETNENDAKAAIKVWAKALAKTRGIRSSFRTEVYKSLPALRGVVRDGRADIVSLRIEEYLEIAGDGLLEPFFVGVRGEDTKEEFLLVAHRDPGPQSLADLENKSLIVLDGARTGMSGFWLNSILLEHGYPTGGEFFREVSRARKVSQALLPVFFRQEDACLVTRSGFETTTELNPQVGKQLAVIRSSPPILPSILCIRRAFSSDERGEIIRALDGLHEDTQGQQVLLLFRIDKLIRFTASDLETAREFFDNVGKADASATLARTKSAEPGPK